MTALAKTARWKEPALVVTIAIAGLWITFNLLAFAFAEAPRATLGRAFAGTWGTPYGIGQVLFKATPLVFTGFAFHIAQRAGLFNIGAEGQLAFASLCGAAFAAGLPAATPAPAATEAPPSPAAPSVARAFGPAYTARPLPGDFTPPTHDHPPRLLAGVGYALGVGGPNPVANGSAVTSALFTGVGIVISATAPR